MGKREGSGLATLLEKYSEPAFTKSEQIKASDLVNKKISQSALLERLKKYKHLALFFNNELEAVILDYQTYEKLYQAMELVDELLDEADIAEKWGHRINAPRSQFKELPEGTDLKDLYDSLHEGSDNVKK